MKRRALFLYLLPLAALMISCNSSYNAFDSDPLIVPGGPGGGGTNPGLPGTNKYDINGKVKLNASITARIPFLKKAESSRDVLPLSLKADNFSRFSKVSECDMRLMGDVILRHRSQGQAHQLIERLKKESDDRGQPIFQIDEDVLRGQQSGDEWLYTRLRIAKTAKDYLRYCDRRSSTLNKNDTTVMRYIDDAEKGDTAVQRSFRTLAQDERSGLQRLLSIYGEESGSATPNYFRCATQTPYPNDPKYASQQWHYEAIGAPAAWNFYRQNPQKFSNVAVAVIDTGIDYRHPDLRQAILTGKDAQNVERGVGYDFISEPEIQGDEAFQKNADPLFGKDEDGIDSNPFDNGDAEGGSGGSFHGTHVAGTIAALTDNGIGGSGIALNAKIVPIRVLGVGGGSDYDIAQGILWAAGLPTKERVPSIAQMTNQALQRVDIINMSLGGPSPSPMIEEAVRKAYVAGVLVVAAAGNEQTDRPSYPASYAEAIGVGAIYPDSQGYDLARYSNYGPNVDLVAPGGDGGQSIFSTWVTYSEAFDDIDQKYHASYKWMRGTSMAAPHVAGALAVLKGFRPQFTPDQLRSVLISTAVKSNLVNYHPNDYGYGLIHLPNALQQIDEASNKLSKGSVTITAAGKTTKLDEQSISADNAFTFHFKNVPAGQYTLQATLKVNGTTITSEPKTIHVPLGPQDDTTIIFKE